MPELCDLPPELIERIFAFTDEYVRAAQYQLEEPWNEDEPVAIPTAPVFRLTNKYIESATRRLFIDTFFDTWHIKSADDQSIQRFCTIVNTSDLLVERLKGLAIYADDDQEIAKRQGQLQPDGDVSLDTEPTHVLDDETGAMVPVAYFRNREKIIQAFLACKNLHGLYFYRSAGRERLQRDPSADKLPESESDVELWSRWLGDERWFDVTTSVTYMLFLAHAAGVSIRRISTSRDWLSTSSFAWLVKYNSALQDMDELILTIGYGVDGFGKVYDSAFRLGNQLLESLTNMRVLRKLCLASFDTCPNMRVWEILSECPTIPTLEELAIEHFSIFTEDFTKYVLKHKKTLKVLNLHDIQWVLGSPSVLGWFYGELSDANQLEEINQSACRFGLEPYDRLGIPNHLLRPKSDVEENEDGFILVHVPRTDIHYKGKEQVKEVLKECAVSMQST